MTLINGCSHSVNLVKFPIPMRPDIQPPVFTEPSPGILQTDFKAFSLWWDQVEKYILKLEANPLWEIHEEVSESTSKTDEPVK